MSKMNYKAWDVKLSDYPKNGTIEEKITFFTRFGILAANIHNTQPWFFDIKANTLVVSPNQQYQLSPGDPSGNNMYITLGCCIENIEIVASYFKFKTVVSFETTLDKMFCVLKFQKSKSQDKQLARLAPYITKRYSNKRPYLRKPIEKSKQQILKNVRVGNIKSLFIDDSETRSKIAVLQKSAVKGVASKSFTKELGYWVTANNTKRFDGMPGFVEGFSSLMALLGKFLLYYFPSLIVAIIAKKNKKILENSPLIGTILMENMDGKEAVLIGRLYQKIAVTATSLGLNCTPMHAVIEDKRNLKKLINLLRLKQQEPRFLFRLGYSNNKPYHTPRRNLETFYKESFIAEQKIIKSIATPIVLHDQKIDDYTLHYVVAGVGDPLLLLHGLNIGWGQWYPNIAELAKKFRVYAIDLPGSGSSTRINLKNANFEKDFVRVVEKFVTVNKLKKVNIIGHSSGALVALKLAQRKKIKINKVVAVCPMGFSRSVPFLHSLLSVKPMAKFLSKTAMKTTNKNMHEFLTMPMMKKKINEEFVDYYVSTLNRDIPTHPFLLINTFLEKFKLKETLFLLKGKKIDNNTLIILGDHDPNVKPIDKDQAQALIPHAAIKIYKNAGHVPSMEYANKFNAEVIQFMK